MPTCSRRFAFSLGILVACLAGVTHGQQAITTLEPGVPVEGELAAGQKHLYRLALLDDQYARVVVDQRGIDVIVRLIGTDGQSIAEFDSELRLNGPESAEWIASATGAFTVQVESKGKAAGRYRIELAEAGVATATARSLEEAARLTRESNRLLNADQPNEARALAERALAIREEVLGPDDPAVAETLRALAAIEYGLEDFARSRALFERAVAIGESTLPPDHPALAEALRGLASVYHMQGQYSKATVLYERALAMDERALGLDHPEVLRIITSFAKHYNAIRDNVQAERLYQRALTIAERSFGKRDPAYAKALSNLATNYKDLGDYGKAASMFQQALGILEQSYGPDNPYISPLLINYGLLCIDTGDYERAVVFFQRTLELLKKLPPNDFDLTLVLNNLGRAYLGAGQYDDAQAVLEHALVLREKLFGGAHMRVALCLSDLAEVYRAKGDFAKAEPLYQRALDILEKVYGSDHLDLIGPLEGLAIIYNATNDTARSIASERRANAIGERTLTYNLMRGSERQKLAYLASLSDAADRVVSLHLQSAPDNSDARTMAVEAVLQRKGRVLDWMTDSLAVLRRRFGLEDRALIDRVNDTNTQLATLVLDGPQKQSLTEHERRITELEEQREQIENQISRESAGYYQPSKPATVDAIQAAIPPGGALIEFSVYRPFDPRVRGYASGFGEPRYVAYVLRPQHEVRWADLGDVKVIDSLIDAVRIRLRDPQAHDVNQAARALDETLMQPVRLLLGDATRLLIAPDGYLNLLPFEALVDEHNRYLIERYSCTYLTSGRDLLRLSISRPSKSDPVVVANPMFGEPRPGAADGMRRIAVNRRRSVTTGSDLSQVYFAPLVETDREARTIKSVFPETMVFTRTRATEFTLRQVAAPTFLHIATHGFFLSPNAVQRLDAPTGTTRSIHINASIENPLLRSGLALAGANLQRRGDDDGILTALEASGLNLWGTKLVTLSACDTGVGEIKAGEGVYGLRRAFFLAGAEALVMSLWPVSDYVTREMMTSYYTGLKAGLGRGDALRQAELAMLKRPNRRHPFYWASFIQAGDWRPLN